MTVVTLNELSELGDGEALPAGQKGWLRSALRSRKVQVGLIILGIFIFAAFAGPSLVGNPSTTSVIGLAGHRRLTYSGPPTRARTYSLSW